jgi:hypothetical protein
MIEDELKPAVRGPDNNSAHRSKRAKITFRDSMKMLPGSFANLGETFSCSTVKGKFPHAFASLETLEYKGEDPATGAKDFDFKKECLRYLKADVDLLYEILTHFDREIAVEYKLDFTKY